MAVDLLFLSWNRAEFTEVTLRCLVENTSWERVRKLVIYDDGSEPDQLRALTRCLPSPAIGVPIDFRHTDRLGPPGVMLDYLRHDPAEAFAKIDNDIAVPRGWLDEMVRVWEASDLDLLGMEIGHPRGLTSEPWPEEIERRTWEPCRHIGGVGLMRSEALTRGHPPMKPSGRFGFTEYQHTHKTRSGWVFPEINAPCLDRVPVEPYASLSAEYVRRGWQREWWQYPQTAHRFWDWIGQGVLV